MEFREGGFWAAEGQDRVPLNITLPQADLPAGIVELACHPHQPESPWSLVRPRPDLQVPQQRSEIELLLAGPLAHPWLGDGVVETPAVARHRERWTEATAQLILLGPDWGTMAAWEARLLRLCEDPSVRQLSVAFLDRRRLERYQGWTPVVTAAGQLVPEASEPSWIPEQSALSGPARLAHLWLRFPTVRWFWHWADQSSVQEHIAADVAEVTLLMAPHWIPVARTQRALMPEDPVGRLWTVMEFKANV